MANYADKLLSIVDKQKKLQAEESKLIEKRKVEIGALAEKFGLLTVSDEVLIGIFSEVKNAIDKKTDKLKEWEKFGNQMNKPRAGKATNHAKAQPNTETA
ncbi:MAG: hypothetical protein HKM04_05625 [Legionellales bacterium]|nr:hypothetical protein [Legionellales bacterium]